MERFKSQTSNSGSTKQLRKLKSKSSSRLSQPPRIAAMESEAEIPLMNERETARERWTSRTTFLLASIGSAVGLGNIWRFPYLVAKHGGAAFIIAYVVVLLLIALPLLTLELSLGQKYQGGAADAFGALNPRFRGIGLASVLSSFILSTYYCVILAWAALYFFESMIPDLPYSGITRNITTVSYEDMINASKEHFSQTHYGANTVDDIENTFNFFGFGTLLLIWLVVYLSIFKGIRVVSHIVKVTATAPIFIIGILAIMGAFQDGAGDGLMNYIGKVELNYLGKKDIWIDAIGQAFFSIGLCMGSIPALASYNPLNRPVTTDGKIICTSDLVAALLSGISVYTMLGFVKTKCKETALDISKCNDIYKTGSFGLAFVIYPVGISNSTASHLWGLLFFGCLLFLGIDSAYAMVISLTTVLEDAWFCKRLNLKKPVLNGIVCVTGCFLGTIYLFDSGLFYLDIADHFVTSWCLLLIGFLETVSVGWLFRVKDQFAKVGYFSVILYDICFFVSITLGVIIALSGNKDSDVDVIWVGVFIGAFVWIFGLVAAVLLSKNKNRGGGIMEKVWDIAGWHGPDVIRSVVNSEYSEDWVPNERNAELQACIRVDYVSITHGFLIKYIIPGILLLLLGLEVNQDFRQGYNSYPMEMLILGVIIVMTVILTILVVMVWPRVWYDPNMTENEGVSFTEWLKWIAVPSVARGKENISRQVSNFA